MFTVGELFAGIGGFSLAFHAAGARTAWFVEREPYCQQVLAKNFPDVPVYGDIYDCHDLPYVDVITAGFPCQPFSLAGKRQGENDERYLVPEMLRVIQEVQPYVVLLENVPGFASLTDGDTFKQLLRALAEMGLDAQWGHLRASDVGAPHQRERWFCVAYRIRPKCETWKGNGVGAGKQTLSPARFSNVAYASRSGRGHNTWGQKARTKIITNSSMGNAISQRSGTGTALKTRHAQTHQQRHSAAGQPRWHAKQSRIKRAGQLVYPHAAGRRKHRRGVSVHPQFTAAQHTGRRAAGAYAQSRMGGTVDGLSARLDRHQWPARPGEPQCAHEPPHTTTRREQRAARLKALGNAVVPQVVYPIACAIIDYLETQAQQEAASA